MVSLIDRKNAHNSLKQHKHLIQPSSWWRTRSVLHILFSRFFKLSSFSILFVCFVI